MTSTQLETDSIVSWNDSGSTVPQDMTPGNQPLERLPGVSRFVADTCIFFDAPHSDWTGEGHWGIGFGPAGTHAPGWSLFHCVSEDRFDWRSNCAQLNPSDQDLHRWASTIVGSDTATSLLESVGSCPAFYRRYFAERPDLGGHPAVGGGDLFR